MPSAAFLHQIRYGYPEPPGSSTFDAFVAEQKKRHTGDDMSPLTCTTCHMPYASNVMEVYWCESWNTYMAWCAPCMDQWRVNKHPEQYCDFKLPVQK